MGTGNWTLSVWTNTTDITGLNSILGTDISGAGDMFLFNQNFQPERISLFEGVGGGFEFRADPTPIDIWDGEFHHIVFIRDGQGSNSKIYVDGVSKSISQNVQNNLNGNAIAQIGAALNVATPVNFFNGTLDEMGWWNRSLTATEVGNLNNGGVPLPFLGLSVILNSPENNHISPTSEVEFNCSAIAVSGSTIINISLWTNETGTWVLNDTQDFTGIGGLKNTSVFTKSYPDADILDWTCRAFNSDDFGAWAVKNRTLNVDVTSPQITINKPFILEGISNLGGTQELNWSIVEPNLDSIWFEYNNINTTLTGLINSTNFTLGVSPFNLTLYANDSVGNINSSFREWEYKIFVNNETFNTSSFETASETYSIDVSANSSLTSATLVWNNENNTASQDGNVWTSIIDIPTGIGNRTFNWSFTYGIETITSTSNNITINSTNLSICGGDGGDISFINFTFKNETLGIQSVNSTISSTFVYWSGSGVINKTLSFINATENSQYSFCSTPANRSLNINYLINYNNANSQQRTFGESRTVSRLSLEKILYLLPSNLGIFTTFRTEDTISNVLSLDNGIITRTISGSLVTISSSLTDSSGIVVFFLNPDATYSGDFSKTGFITNTFTFVPITDIRVVVMGTGGEVLNGSQIGLGTTYETFPRNSSLINDTDYVFGFNVTSDQTIILISMNITNETGSQISFQSNAGT